MDVETRVLIKMDDGCDDLFPKKAHDSDAAYDLFASEEVILANNEVKAVSVGFRMQLSPGWEAQIRPRSGLALKQGLFVVNSPGTIDSGYRGPVKVILKYTGIIAFVGGNAGSHWFTIKRGDRIAQMVIGKIYNTELVKVSELENSDRGEKGFGSTGVK